MKQNKMTLLPPGHPWRQHLIQLDSVDSTNRYAKDLARQGAPEGTVVIAGEQTEGRGRLGRSFSSPVGMGLYLSLILRPDCEPHDIMHLTCAVGVAAAEAVEKVCGIRPGIKWTNDLVFEKRKLGGILTELSVSPDTGKVDFVVVGIGINCRQQLQDFPAELQGLACSLLTACGRPAAPEALAAELIAALHFMRCGLFTQKIAIMEQFRKDCVTPGKEISVLRGENIRHGTALAVDEDGGLVVAFPDGSRETISSGEVSIRGMYGYL